MYIDTHCHIHESDYPIFIEDTLKNAADASVCAMICVGTDMESSRRAVEFAERYDQLYASIGVHPHDSQNGYKLKDDMKSTKTVAIGEIGLDYFYTNSSREIQIAALEWQLDFAKRHDLPVIFHVREAFNDFWPIFDNFRGIRGVLHSFTDSSSSLDQALGRNLYIGVNGISTFTRDAKQQDMFASIPLEKLLLETDAPFLTPNPLRGKVNEPAFVTYVAQHHATIRSIEVSHIATLTSANARTLFALK